MYLFDFNNTKVNSNIQNLELCCFRDWVDFTSPRLTSQTNISIMVWIQKDKILTEDLEPDPNDPRQVGELAFEMRDTLLRQLFGAEGFCNM